MSDLHEQPEGATPIDPDERAGLIPQYINTRAELNTLEKRNIIKAVKWIENNRKQVLTVDYMCELHRKMFREVWHWAGDFRKSDKNIGDIPWQRVPEEVYKLCQDTAFWIKNSTYDWDELGARFHHRLTWIHPFPNGNGRHARLITDALFEENKQKLFSWGLHQVECGDMDEDQNRELYISLLREADEKNFVRLLQFVRS